MMHQSSWGPAYNWCRRGEKEKRVVTGLNNHYLAVVGSWAGVYAPIYSNELSIKRLPSQHLCCAGIKTLAVKWGILKIWKPWSQFVLVFLSFFHHLIMKYFVWGLLCCWTASSGHLGIRKAFYGVRCTTLKHPDTLFVRVSLFACLFDCCLYLADMILSWNDLIE